MADYTTKMQSYWDNRFRAENRIWGETPSNSAYHALALFNSINVKSVLVPGAGYGRNSQVFSRAGLQVTGLEISPIAIKLANQTDPKTMFIQKSVLELDDLNMTFDAIYCFNVLHLFREPQRKLFIKKCLSVLNKNGVFFFVIFSEKEKSFGEGDEVEPGTFESKPGRPVHYFTGEDLMDHFKEFHLLEKGKTEDTETHGEEGKHTHILRYIFCMKP
ncbi:MAG: class I SAM-dependent methyltransferase [Chloroflexi bacterium]|nr:class I SAM-dependent methyltransferase [Chloroflexota bacterium]